MREVESIAVRVSSSILKNPRPVMGPQFFSLLANLLYLKYLLFLYKQISFDFLSYTQKYCFFKVKCLFMILPEHISKTSLL